MVFYKPRSLPHFGKLMQTNEVVALLGMRRLSRSCGWSFYTIHACRHFVKDRCELSGMRWNQTGAENLLRLRAVAENDDWDAYHNHRKQQRYTRLYGSPDPNPEAIEVQVMNTHPTVL
jgi:hypothetical protein